MRPAFHPRLVNDPFGDPGLFVPFHFERRALMFDLGDLGGLTSRELLSISHAFVSHAHMDHFIGFDTLLRTVLGRDQTLYLYGPSGFFERIEGRLAGYTWNLVEEFANDVHLVVTEVREETLVTRTYISRKRFRTEGLDRVKAFQGPVLEEPRFCVEAAVLDHRIPCLAFALKERFHVNIDKAALAGLGLPVGAWLDEFKAALYEERDPSEEFEVTWIEDGGIQGARRFTLGKLAEDIARVSPGKHVAYVTDAIASPVNCGRIRRLAWKADHLFIEAAFLKEEEKLARDKHHLTAAQAGTLAREAGVRALTLFHFSPRYRGREVEFEAEAMAAYRASSGDDSRSISEEMIRIKAR